MPICAQFSALYGWWNEQLQSDRGVATALKHLVEANLLATHAILDVRASALFIQSASSEYCHAATPDAIGPADTLNARRFLLLDLNHGRRADSTMHDCILDNDARGIPFFPQQ